MNQITGLARATQPDMPQDAATGTLPHSIEAEQQLLGALLTNDQVYDRVAQIVQPAHFFDPVHRRIFETAVARLSDNKLVTPVTLANFLSDDAGLKELGGPAYLVRLAAASISTYAAKDYAELIRDLAMRRQLIDLGRNIADKAARVTADSEPRDQIVEAEQQLYLMGETGQVNQGFQSFLSAATSAINVG